MTHLWSIQSIPSPTAGRCGRSSTRALTSVSRRHLLRTVLLQASDGGVVRATVPPTLQRAPLLATLLVAPVANAGAARGMGLGEAAHPPLLAEAGVCAAPHTAHSKMQHTWHSKGNTGVCAAQRTAHSTMQHTWHDETAHPPLLAEAGVCAARCTAHSTQRTAHSMMQHM